jgi:dihydroorotase
MTLNALSAIMSERPAKLLGIKKGLIEPGYAGDIVLVDENRCEAIDPDKFVSKGKNSPFKGMATYGKVMMTVKAGKVVYQGENDVSR